MCFYAQEAYLFVQTVAQLKRMADICINKAAKRCRQQQQKKPSKMTYQEKVFAVAQKTSRIVFASMLPAERVQYVDNTFVRVHPNGQIEGMDAEIQAADDAAHVGEYEPTHGVEWRMKVLHNGQRPLDMGLDLED